MPPRKKTSTTPTPVDAIVHASTRANLPTADAQEFVSPGVEETRTLQYPRDPSLDPQLVWKGKDDERPDGLHVVAPPIFIQEKIDPRVLVENLRDTAEGGAAEPELSLFESFDGLDELEIVEFYKHRANWSNRMILGDSLQAMASLAEREQLQGQVQMVYLDPPYGIRFGSNWQVSSRSRDVRDGRREDASQEAEQIRAFRDTWSLGIHSYLSYMRDRLTAARSLLTPSGSVFVQIGDQNQHLIRSLMDEVFGSENWVSNIIFTKTTSSTGARLGGTVDYLVWYANDIAQLKYRPLYRPKGTAHGGADAYGHVQLPDGSRRRLTPEERNDPGVLPDGSRIFKADNLTSQAMGRAKGKGAASWFPVEIDGRVFTPGPRARWKTNAGGMERLLAAGRVYPLDKSLSYVRYLDDFPASSYSELWGDVGGARDKTYVVQTATKVIERCLLMTTDAGDLVVDPTCGSGTTGFVAEQWGRRWILIDSSRVALSIARQRLMGAQFPFYLLRDSPEGRRREEEVYGSPSPTATPSGDVTAGFVCERIPHVTLKSIASNPEIMSGMDREEIAAAIIRRAESETLLDRPYILPGRVRVAGPFSIETLAPHRSATPHAGDPPAGDDAARDTEFRDRILENLSAAGIQNGIRADRLRFEELVAHAGGHIHAVGTALTTAGKPDALRVAVSIGPEYGTIGGAFVKAAAREAIAAGEAGLLCVLGFSFDPMATHEDDEIVSSEEGFDVTAERSLGPLRVLLVRMNTDLLGGDDLEKTAAANLFMVFGRPDISITVNADKAVVRLDGIDVYDPLLDEIRSASTDKVALWMIDTNYNGESFFVRHCYFTGGIDPYKRLKRVLRADIDEEAWASLYRTESRPFPLPETGRIAVKVINDYGDEVVQVFDVGPAA